MPNVMFGRAINLQGFLSPEIWDRVPSLGIIIVRLFLKVFRIVVIFIHRTVMSVEPRRGKFSKWSGILGSYCQIPILQKRSQDFKLAHNKVLSSQTSWTRYNENIFCDVRLRSPFIWKQMLWFSRVTNCFKLILFRIEINVFETSLNVTNWKGWLILDVFPWNKYLILIHCV